MTQTQALDAALALLKAPKGMVEIAPFQLVNQEHVNLHGKPAPFHPVDETTRSYWATLRARHP